jgi:hypothetical protein
MPGSPISATTARQAVELASASEICTSIQFFCSAEPGIPLERETSPYMNTKRPLPLLLVTSALFLGALAPAARAQFAVSFSTAVDTSTAILNGTGNFTDFPGAPGLDYGNVIFFGLGAGGQKGIYVKYPLYSRPGDPYKVMADLNTAIPGGTGNFTDFPLINLSLSGDLSVFLGAGSGNQLGVYVKSPQEPYRIIADRSTAIPDGTGSFTTFIPSDLYSPVAISGDNVVFYGTGDANQEGLYLSRPGSSILRVADRNTPIPDGTGTFTTFVPPSPMLPPNPIIGGDTVAFFGFGAAGQQGIYRFLPPSPILPAGSLSRIVDTTTAIPSSTVAGSTFGYFQCVSMDDGNMAFTGGAISVVTSDGQYIPAQQGVYKDIGSDWQRVADLTTIVPGSSAAFTGFGAVAIDPGYVVFDAYDGNSVHGLYTDFGGGLHKILAIGDTVNGKVLEDFYWSQFGFSVGSSAQIAFTAEFTDGSKAISLATLTIGPCPRSHGYWKNNPKSWPVSSLTLGSQTYSKPELLTILKSSTTSDASMILARQLIAAKLNIASGSDGSPVSSTITHADSLLSGFAGKLPYKVKTTSTIGKALVNDATTLNNYNNGQLTQFCVQ